MAGFTSFDDDTAAGAVDASVGGAVPIELPPELQDYGMLWPNPGDQVSDHSAEGAPWVAAAGTDNQPSVPPQGPLWRARHTTGAWVPFDANAAQDSITGAQIAAAPSPNHRGTDGQGWNPGAWGPHGTQPNAWPQNNIGKPFTVNQGSGETRTLATDQWDDTGKRVNPPDAPSAPHQLYGSQHYTRPRLIPFALAALFNWNWAESQQFTDDPGYYGVQGAEPDMAPRPQGAVAAQMPSDPYVAAAVPGAVTAAVPDYDMGL
jgi:hypothetical protein